jgi:antitoxin component YwqK of YwqJK toxin-antitoxin module
MLYIHHNLNDSTYNDTISIDSVVKIEDVYAPDFPYIALDTQALYYLKVELMYSEGMKRKAVAYNENGVKSMESCFNESGLNGLKREWYWDGEIKSYDNYESRRKISPGMKYYKNGTPWVMQDLKLGGEAIQIVWNKTGNRYRYIVGTNSTHNSFKKVRHHQNGQIIDSMEANIWNRKVCFLF